VVQNGLRRFTYSKTFIVGFGFLGISIIWPIFNQFIPIFLHRWLFPFSAAFMALAWVVMTRVRESKVAAVVAS
jgi:hypothetical protein